MAHKNIRERRVFVRRTIESGQEITPTVAKQIGDLFECSYSAVLADVVRLNTRSEKTSIYLTPNMRRKVYARDGRECQYCGESDKSTSYVIEHIIPAAWGGPARPFNLVVACASCNFKKGRSAWIPKNLDIITRSHPSWKEEIISLCSPALGNTCGGKRKGSGRPSEHGVAKRKTSVTLHPELCEAINRAALKRGLSRSQMIELSMIGWLKEQEGVTVIL